MGGVARDERVVQVLARNQMIRMGWENEVIFILEPANLKRLRQGERIPVDMNQHGVDLKVFLAYTPDVEWMEKQIEPRMPISQGDLGKLLAQGMALKEVDRGKRAN